MLNGVVDVRRAVLVGNVRVAVAEPFLREFLRNLSVIVEIHEQDRAKVSDIVV